jgi:hypothetical protein
MDEYKLKHILRKAFPMTHSDDIAISLYADYNKKIGIPEQYLRNDYNYRLLFFDYKKYGFEYKGGKIDCCGIYMRFSHKDYNYLTVSVEFDFATQDIFNCALLILSYKEEHFFGRKSIKQSAVKVLCDKDFKQYKKRIDKKYL